VTSFCSNGERLPIGWIFSTPLGCVLLQNQHSAPQKKYIMSTYAELDGDGEVLDFAPDDLLGSLGALLVSVEVDVWGRCALVRQKSRKENDGFDNVHEHSMTLDSLPHLAAMSLSTNRYPA
jgi:hypothetical protein